MIVNPLRWRRRHQAEIVILALVGMAIGSVTGYVAEALGAESIDYWMWGKWPFNPREVDAGSFWWLVGGGLIGVASAYAYRLMRPDTPSQSPR